MFSAGGGKNNDVVIFKIEGISRLTLAATRKAWFSVGKDLLRTANTNILKRPRHGNTYWIKNRGKTGGYRRHVASVPDESHANMYGDLRKSLSWKVQGYDLGWGYGVSTVPAPKHAKYMEFGTRKIKPRPSLQISMKFNMRNTQNSLIEATKREFK